MVNSIWIYKVFGLINVKIHRIYKCWVLKFIGYNLYGFDDIVDKVVIVERS